MFNHAISRPNMGWARLGPLAVVFAVRAHVHFLSPTVCLRGGFVAWLTQCRFGTGWSWNLDCAICFLNALCSHP